MNIKKNIATSENGFIFNPATGDSFCANETAMFVLSSLRTGRTEKGIKAEILERYEVSATQLDRDWDDYLNQLRNANLLETE